MTNPDIERLRVQGWQIISCNGPYCLVWRVNQEVLMLWKEDAWIQVYVSTHQSMLAG